MNIFDLVGRVTPELTVKIPNLAGEDTGEHFILKNPDSGVMVRASDAYFMAGQKIKRDNAELLNVCNETGDYSAYNEVAKPLLAQLDMSFAVTAIAGWSMDDELNDESATKLLTELPYLAQKIIDAFFEEKANQAKK